MPLQHEVPRTTQACRAAAHDRHLLAGQRRPRRQAHLAHTPFVVGHETFEITDRHGLAPGPENARALALLLLRAYTARDGRQHVVLPNFRRRSKVIADHHQIDEVAHLHAPTGQAEKQCCVLQVRQRLASSCAMTASRPQLTSTKLCARSCGGCSGMDCR